MQWLCETGTIGWPKAKQFSQVSLFNKLVPNNNTMLFAGSGRAHNTANSYRAVFQGVLGSDHMEMQDICGRDTTLSKVAILNSCKTHAAWHHWGLGEYQSLTIRNGNDNEELTVSISKLFAWQHWRFSMATAKVWSRRKNPVWQTRHRVAVVRDLARVAAARFHETVPDISRPDNVLTGHPQEKFPKPVSGSWN